MKKNIFICVAVLALILTAAGNLSAKNSYKKTQFTVGSGLNLFTATGSDSDYKAGENDFPVTPTYKALACEIGLTFFTSPSFAVGFDFRYGFLANVDLIDPSDKETISVDTPQNLIAALNLYQYFDLSRQMQFFISLGGGAEYLMAKDGEYTGTLGSKIIILAPEKPLSPLAAVGIGLQYLFSAEVGINFEFRATYVFRNPGQLIISPDLALVLRF
jgi:hypothetical protein